MLAHFSYKMKCLKKYYVMFRVGRMTIIYIDEFLYLNIGRKWSVNKIYILNYFDVRSVILRKLLACFVDLQVIDSECFTTPHSSILCSRYIDLYALVDPKNENKKKLKPSNRKSDSRNGRDYNVYSKRCTRLADRKFFGYSQRVYRINVWSAVAFVMWTANGTLAGLESPRILVRC